MQTDSRLVPLGFDRRRVMHRDARGGPAGCVPPGREQREI
jgi:hypothetical protein